MITGTFRFYRLLVQTIRGEDSPKQVAMGIVLGMMAGIVPPDNLIAVMLGTMILATRVNVFAAILSGFAFMWIGFFCDPFYHRLGSIILSAESLSPVWTMLYETPVVPWTKFNNTVVMGSFASGLAIAYPMYYGSEWFVSKYGPRAHKRLLKHGIYRKMAGVKDQEDLHEGVAP